MEDLLSKAKNDYITRKYKRFLLFRKCENCMFYQFGVYHDTCLVKDKLDPLNINALFCRYYNKQGGMK